MEQLTDEILAVVNKYNIRGAAEKDMPVHVEDSGETENRVWMYYETDGDAGYYRIRLFRTKIDAEQHWRGPRESNAYGCVVEMPVYAKDSASRTEDKKIVPGTEKFYNEP